MCKKTLAVVGLLGVVTAAAFVPGVVAPRLSAHSSGFHVWAVTSGGPTCRDMTNNLRTDRDTWRASYFNYVAGFITGANFVSYSAGDRNSNVGADGPPHDAVFASIEQYCGQNPTKHIFEAVTTVYSQLVAK